MVNDAEPVTPLLADEDVFRDRQLRKQGELLVDDLNAVLLGLARRRPAHRRAVEDHLALIRRVGARDDLDQGGLAGAVFADQPVNLARPDLRLTPLNACTPGKLFEIPVSLSMPRRT